jgi:VanZ family protein
VTRKFPVATQALAQGILFLLLIAVVTFADLPGDSKLMGEMQNTAHSVVFALLAWLALSLMRQRRQLKTSHAFLPYLAAFAICLLVGVAIELAQALIHRDADAWDVLRDVAGVTAFLGLYSLWDRHNIYAQAGASKIKILVAAASVSVLLAALFPAAKITYAYVGRELAFPVLMDFTSRWHGSFVSTNHAQLNVVAAPQDWQAASGKLVAKLTLHKARYPGIECKDLHPDWTGFTDFSMSIFSPNPTPFPLIIRIHDQKHTFAMNDRFNRRLLIVPGENVIRIPLAAIQAAPARRRMDMQAIKAVILFAPGLKQDTTVYLREIRLN